MKQATVAEGDKKSKPGKAANKNNDNNENVLMSATLFSPQETAIASVTPFFPPAPVRLSDNPDIITDKSTDYTSAAKEDLTITNTYENQPEASVSTTDDSGVNSAEVVVQPLADAVAPQPVTDAPAPDVKENTDNDNLQEMQPISEVKLPVVDNSKKVADTPWSLFALPQNPEARMSFSKPLFQQAAAKKVPAPAPVPQTTSAKSIDSSKISGLDITRGFLNKKTTVEQATAQGGVPAYRPQQAPDASALKNSGKSIMEQASAANTTSVTSAGKQTDTAIQQNKAANVIKPTIKAVPVKTDGIYTPKSFDSIAPQLEGLPGYKESINETNRVYVDDKIAPKLEEGKLAQASFAQQQADAKTNNDAQINARTQEVKTQQVQQQATAKGEITQHKKNWKKESDDIKERYDKEAKGKKNALGTDIDNEVNTANTQINLSYNKANEDAARETAAAKKSEAEQRAEAERKAKAELSLWDKAVDAVSSVVSDIFNALKKALNKVFDGLRAFVKKAIDTAKAFANTLIDKLKEKVKSFIRAFGEVLKSIANVALSMFPKLRDRFNNFIDAAVNKALKAIDLLAEGLKKAISALLDVLGKVLDGILALAQAYYNALLDVCKFLVEGLIKIALFILNLGIAAVLSQFEFLGAVAEEAIGGNPAKPLQDVEVPEGMESQWAVAMGLAPDATVMQNGEEMIDSNTANLLTKPVLSDDDVTTDPYPAVEIDSNLLNSLPPLKDGERFEIGGAGSKSVTTAQLQQSAYDDDIINAAQTGEAVEGEISEKEEKPAVDWIHMSDEEKLDEYNRQMLQSSTDAGSKGPTPEKVTPEPDTDNSPEALVTKTGRLSIGRRLAFMGEQMITGIRALWIQHKEAIITVLTIALAVILGILIVSGGTALGLVVQAIGEGLILLFGAYAVYRAMGSLWEYVKKAWAGDTKGAAKALATAFAIIVVEFLIDKIMAGMGKVFKRMLKSFKATKAGRFIRNTLAVVRKGQRRLNQIARTGKAVIKNSKFVIFLEKIVAKGAGKLDDLRNKILAKFGFKKIWFEKHSHFMELWGQFNSDVLLMREDIDGNRSVEFVNKNSDLLRQQTGNQLVGQRVNLDGGKGIALSDMPGGNDFSRNTKLINDQEALLDLYDRLDNLSEAERLKKIQTGNPHVSTRADWDAHETAVNHNLAITHPNQKSARQVTLDLYDKNGDFITTIRADNAVIDDFGNVTLIDAKHQANAEIARGIKKPMNTVTENQSIGYPAIKNGNVGRVVPRGEGASELGIINKEFKITPQIEVHTNDINGNIIRMDLDGKIIN